MEQSIEKTILGNLVYNDSYVRMAFPFLKTEYFMNNDEQKLFGIIGEHIEKYKNTPSKEVLHIMLNERENLTEEAYKNIFGLHEFAYENSSISPISHLFRAFSHL